MTYENWRQKLGKLILSLSRWTGKFLCKRRHKSWAKKLIANIWVIYGASENRSYDANENGERRFLEVLSRHTPKDAILFDVGANQGDWTQMAREIFEESSPIHAFEIVPTTFSVMEKKLSHHKNTLLNQFGLSADSKEVEIFVDTVNSEVSSAYQSLFFNNSSTKITCQTKSGDGYLNEKGISQIQLLKIDVEGMESEVLKGFANALENQSIDVIQLEYGFVNIQNGFLLKNIYEQLTSYGYKIGKLYPTGVEFKDYHLYDENFLGPNYIAVLDSREKLIQSLSDFTRVHI
jgi:FkbM family methyltransferase